MNFQINPSNYQQYNGYQNYNVDPNYINNTSPMLSAPPSHSVFSYDQQYQPETFSDRPPPFNPAFMNHSQLNNPVVNYPELNPVMNYPQLNNPVQLPVQNEPSLPPIQTPSDEQIQAWSKFAEIYTKTLIMAAENGVTKVEKPDLGKFQILRNNSIKAQSSLIGKALFLAAKITHVASAVLKFIALVLVANVLLAVVPPAVGLPVVIGSTVGALLAGGASKGLQLVSHLFNKAAWSWTNSYFSKEDKAQIELLKKWQKVEHLNPTAASINETFEACANAIEVDKQSHPSAQRHEWNSHSFQQLSELKSKIEEYNKIEVRLNLPVSHARGTIVR